MPISTIAPRITRHTRGQSNSKKKEEVFYKPVGTPKITQPKPTPQPTTTEDNIARQVSILKGKLQTAKTHIEAQDKLIGNMYTTLSSVTDLAEDGIDTLEEETQDDIFGLSLILDKVTELRRKLEHGSTTKKNSNS